MTKKENTLEATQGLTNPERILYPKINLTKLQLAKYYIAVQNLILPYIVKRPLTLYRCPRGQGEQCFYQKHLEESSPPGILKITLMEKEGEGEYCYIKDLEGLLALVQLGVLEIHPWASRIDNVEKPDMIIFDLDPAPDVDWKTVVDTAFFIKEQLKDIQLKSFLKTTGGKGLHIIIPIKRLYSWNDIKIFADTFVNFIVSQNPKAYLATMSKAKRQGKIFIDHLRNRRGATAIAPYSTRANAHAAIAMPLAWDELTVKLNPAQFNVKNFDKSLTKLKEDPWKDFLTVKQILPFK